MRSALLSALGFIVGATVTFYVEPLIPLGDLRWLVVALVGMLVAVIVWATDPNRVFTPEQRFELARARTKFVREHWDGLVTAAVVVLVVVSIIVGLFVAGLRGVT